MCGTFHTWDVRLMQISLWLIRVLCNCTRTWLITRDQVSIILSNWESICKTAICRLRRRWAGLVWFTRLSYYVSMLHNIGNIGFKTLGLILNLKMIVKAMINCNWTFATGEEQLRPAQLTTAHSSQLSLPKVLSGWYCHIKIIYLWISIQLIMRVSHIRSSGTERAPCRVEQSCYSYRIEVKKYVEPCL